MKSTGIVRKLDELGRITLPIEIRRSLNLEEKDGLEIIVEDSVIILKKVDDFKIIEEFICNNGKVIITKKDNAYTTVIIGLDGKQRDLSDTDEFFEATKAAEHYIQVAGGLICSDQ